MVLCIIGLVVFGILGIFSAKYRSLAKEAFGCVWNMARLRPCQGTLEDRIRREILSKAFRVHPTLAKYVNRYFGLLSWLFVAAFFLSVFLAGQGIYNYAVYGNCNGPQGGFCIFDPLNSGQQANECVLPGASTTNLRKPIDLGHHLQGPADAKVMLIEIGCYTCPFTKMAQPAVTSALKKYEGKIRFAFLPFPLPNHAYSTESGEAAECANEQGKYWEYHNALFERQGEVRDGGMPELKQIAKSVGLDVMQFDACLDTGKYKAHVQNDFQYGISIGVYGTPTFFINGQAFVEPLTEQKLSSLIEAELNK